jgi:ZIP family zinc transporter
MEAFLSQFPPITQALFATLFTWGVTALGAALVFTTREFNQKALDWLLGFAGGVMIAASYWSLLAPSIEIAEAQGMIPWLPPLIGFLLGGIFLRGIDAIFPHLHLGKPLEEAEGLPTRWRRSILLVTAITLHNIPEGLAVGVAFGAAALSLETGSLASAIALAIGIGLQNFPEGIAVAMPLRREGMSRWKAFMYGQASGIVEPIAGVLGASLVLLIQPLLPYALAFAAGAMIYVVVEETIPESHAEGNTDLATLGLMLGFAVMMTLDVALG